MQLPANYRWIRSQHFHYQVSMELQDISSEHHLDDMSCAFLSPWERGQNTYHALGGNVPT